MGTVLALRALGLGDLLTAVPALRGLRDAFPAERLVLAAPAWLGPLVRLTGCVDELRPTAGLGALEPLEIRPALAVNLHGSGPQSIDDLTALRPRALLTHRHPDRPGADGPAWDPERHEVRRWCALLAHGGIPCDPDRLDLAPPPEPSPAPGCVIVHPGGSSGARRWPAERFAAVAAGLRAGGHRVVVTGSAAERPLARAVAAAAGLPDAAVLAGTGDLTALAALVAAARLVVANDTGIGHMATAFGTPSVLIFGPNPPRWWGPPVDRPRHTALWAGHIGDPHAPQPGHGLLAITPRQVLDAAVPHLAALPR